MSGEQDGTVVGRWRVFVRDLPTLAWISILVLTAAILTAPLRKWDGTKTGALLQIFGWAAYIGFAWGVAEVYA